MKLKPVLENMVAHPWPEVESKGDNHKIIEDFAFAGLPYFVFISRMGKLSLVTFIRLLTKHRR